MLIGFHNKSITMNKKLPGEFEYYKIKDIKIFFQSFNKLPLMYGQAKTKKIVELMLFTKIN